MQREFTDILLVEDNPDDVALTLHAFRSVHLTNTVHVARDGGEALEWVFGTGVGPGDVAAPRVILLDLKLPLDDGLEVLRQLKADPRTRMIPVVVLTSSQEERDLIASYQLGVSSYIVKPVDFEQYTAAMQTLGMYWLVLNQPAPGQASPEQDSPA